MKCKVARDFPYAHDGVNVKPLKKGDEVEIRDHLVEGLRASGRLEPAEGEGAGKSAAKPSKKAAEGAEGGEGGAGDQNPPA